MRIHASLVSVLQAPPPPLAYVMAWFSVAAL